MEYSGGFTGALSPDAVRTGIDAVLYEEFTRTKQPSYVGATNTMFFHQGSTVGKSFIHDEDVGVGDFEEAEEQEEFLNTDSFIGNKVTRNSQKYYKQVPISDEAFRADMVGKREAIGRSIGEHARQTQDKKALQNTYADAFAGSVFTTPDAQPLASNAHVGLKGATIDNLETGALTPDNLWTLVNSLVNQKAQDGDAGSHTFDGFLSNFLLYKTVKEVLGSPLLANSTENNLNVFETDFGQVSIGASIFLGSNYNTASNANTSYHIVSRNHQILRKVFYGLTTDMKTPKETNNDTHAMTAKFNEVAFPGTWTAYAGSNGTV
jgi:hypothetical protein